MIKLCDKVKNQVWEFFNNCRAKRENSLTQIMTLSDYQME